MFDATTPTPEEIAEATARIRAGWTEAEHHRRFYAMPKLGGGLRVPSLERLRRMRAVYVQIATIHHETADLAE
ncbi:MAG: hypothetical protein KY475_11970 [Planctomycetes bacterium]|nr:hypothetical protein [Planctomycetota bacterium]